MSKTVWTVTYQDAQVEALEAEQIRVFEEKITAEAYAKLLSKDHDYVRMYESEVNEWRRS
jgi:hypothetical protein|tara:strand:- start:2532 stop:2711 length:180 start_codon:yes stop_codon:yes gene_type:complete